MGNEQSGGSSSTNQNNSILLLGQTPFCATAAVGTTVHALAPCEIKKPEPPPAAQKTEPPTNQFKKKSFLTKGLSIAKKGATLAKKGAKAGYKMALGATLRPKLIPGQEATRTCFLCFAAANENEAGSPVLYGVDVFLRANVNDGAVLRKDGEGGHLKFRGIDLEGACAVQIISSSGKQTGSPVRLGEQFILTVDQGARVFVFCGADDGGIVLETRPIAEVPTNENAVFKCAPIPPKLQRPVQEETGGDSDFFVMLLGAETASQMRLVKQLASNPIGRQIIKQQLRGGTVSKPKYR
jgi:hypothetical protein